MKSIIAAMCLPNMVIFERDSYIEYLQKFVMIATHHGPQEY